jgi:CheY-like chemotaxis protein
MGSRVTQLDAAAKLNEEVADKGNDGLGGPGHNCETSLNNSDSFNPLSSNCGEGPEVPSDEKKRMGKQPVKRGTRQILVVDDEVAIADTLALILQTQRYEARVAYSAERAIELIAEWRPDLAILDVILPEMNGIELAIVIKANHPRCHVLLFSGHANTAMLLEEAGKKGHEFEILAKPVHPDLMLERASALLTAPDDPVYD